MGIFDLSSHLTGGLLLGAQYMAASGLGTVRTMLSIGLFGRLIPISLRLQLRRAIPLSVWLLATLLILRGLSLGIPYFSLPPPPPAVISEEDLMPFLILIPHSALRIPHFPRQK